jgi:hypothetical protein
MEQAKYWSIIDAQKDNWKAQISALRSLNFVHIRRARLLGLDAPTKLDVSGIYQRGGADVKAERHAREAVLQALPIEEQRRIYEIFYQAGLRAQAGDFSQPAIETTVSNGNEQRTDHQSESESDDKE